MQRRAVMSGSLESAAATAALSFLVTCVGVLAPNGTLAQVAERSATTPSDQPGDATQKSGLWTVRLEHRIEHDYSPPKPLEEITVRGQKPVSAYRRDIDAAEIDVWEAFNNANSDDLFDVTCHLEAPLGTRIPQQVCRPEFLDQATSRAASAMLQLDKSSSVGMQQIEVGRAHFLMRQLKDEMRGLATSEPQLKERVEDYADKVEDYDEARSHRRQ